MRAALLSIVLVLAFAAFAGAACARLDSDEEHYRTMWVLFNAEKTLADSEAITLVAVRKELDEARRQAGQREALLRQCQEGSDEDPGVHRHP